MSGPTDISDLHQDGVNLGSILDAAQARPAVTVQDEAARTVAAKHAMDLLDRLGTRLADPSISADEAGEAIIGLMDDGPLTALAIGWSVMAIELQRRLSTMSVPHGARAARTGLIALIRAKVREMERTDREAQAREVGRQQRLRLTGLELPKGMFAPAGWRMDQDGVEEVTVAKDGDLNCVRILPRPMLVVARGVGEVSAAEDGGNTDHYSVLAWPDPSHPHRWVRSVVRDDVMGSRAGLVKLRRHGAPVDETCAAAAVRFICAFAEANAGVLPKTLICQRLGWHQSSFLLGEQAVVAADQQGEPLGLALDMPLNMAPIARAIRTRGTMEGWLDIYRDQVAHRPLVLAAVYASCAAPLVHLLNAKGFMVDWSDDSTGGKSTTHNVAASVWGVPSENGGFIYSWRTSPAWIGNALGFVHHLPLIMDDTSKLEDTRILTGLIYDIAGGREKGRGQADGGIQKQSTWRTVLISNGEAPATSFVTKTGAVARVLTIKGPPFGRAEKGSAEELRLAADAESTEFRLQEHHGHVGQRLIRWLVDHPEQIGELRAYFQQRRTAWRTAASPHGKIAMRLSVNVAVLDVAAHILHTHLGIPLPEDPDAVWGALMASICSGGQDSDRPSAALADLYSWAVGNADRFDPRSKVRADRVGAWLAPSPWRELEPSQNIWREVGFRPQVVRELLSNWGYEPNNVLQVWQDRGWTPRNSRRLGVARPFCGARANLLVLSRDAIDGIIADSGEEASRAEESF